MADSDSNDELFFCYGCMHQLANGETLCDQCGYDNSHIQNNPEVLPEGMVLGGIYLVGKMLGRGGFGVTYMGYDFVHQEKIAIKEYFPMGICLRDHDTHQVLPISASDASKGFTKGLKAFQNEALNLSKFNSPYIVHIRSFLQENGTAYIIMDYVDGLELGAEVGRCGGRMYWKRVVSLFSPLILEIGKLHENHMIHRDIKPPNLKVVAEKDDMGEHLVLLDFGSARNYVSEKVSKTYTTLITPGYSPVEQYSIKSKQGPRTDIYSICATMYAAITGEVPPAATDMVSGLAVLKPFTAFGITMPSQIERAILHGMQLQSASRPATMEELYEELNPGDPSDLETTRINVSDRDQSIYETARKRMAEDNRNSYREALRMLRQISGYEDAAELAQQCENRIKELRKDEIYLSAQTAMQNGETEKAQELFRQIPNWKDSSNILTTLERKPVNVPEDLPKEVTEKPEPSKTASIAPLPILLGAAAAVVVIICLLVFKPFGKSSFDSEGKPSPTAAVITSTAPEPTAAETPLPTLTATETTAQETIIPTEEEATSIPTAEAETEEPVTEPEMSEDQGSEDQTEAEEKEYEIEYRNGNYAAAFPLIVTAVEADDPDAQYRLGTMYETGTFVEQSYTYAAEYYQQAAEQNHAEALYSLGELYENGLGVEASMDQALNYYQRAADQGHVGALEKLEKLDGNDEEDEREIPEDTLTQDFSALQAGDSVYYGRYEQDGNRDNGTEVIEWQVLAVWGDGEYALVISKNILEVMSYSQTLFSGSPEWESSYLRAWLNGEFLSSVFSEAERARIIQTSLQNTSDANKSGGNDTTDSVFLLSTLEVESYFSSDSARGCRATVHAQNKGAVINPTSRNSSWWLRTPGTQGGFEAYVNVFGMVNSDGTIAKESNFGVRPAFTLYLR